MTFDPQSPYNALPLLPPRKDIETKAVLKQCLSATRALAELKGSGRLIPDQTILINAIPLQEAKLSSEIENIVTTQDELFRAALDEAHVTDPQTKEVLRYRSALRHGYEHLSERPFSMDLILEMCALLRGETVDFRAAHEHVAIGNPQTRHIIYTPPSGGAPLRKKIENWSTTCCPKTAPIRSFAWPWPTINLKPFIPLRTAMAAPAAF